MTDDITRPTNTPDDRSTTRRLWYWFDTDTVSFVNPSRWCVLVGGEPVDGYCTLSAGPQTLYVRGRTDDIGVEILSDACEGQSQRLPFAVSHYHNYSRAYDSLEDAKDESVIGRDTHHEGEGAFESLETARASPDPRVRVDRFDRAFSVVIYAKRQFALDSASELEAVEGIETGRKGRPRSK